MINRYGLLTRSEKSENQDTIRDPELSKILNDLYITDNKDFWGELNGWCTTSSSNRCCFYMSLNYENKTYTKPNRKIPYVLPTYGVKGSEAISRDMKYVNQYLQRQEDMLSSRFIDYVFGTRYIEHAEPQTLISESEIIDRMRQRLAGVSHEVEETDVVCRILERIWEAREQDSKTRIILVLGKDHIEENSMNLLRQLYLLMPQRLRVQTGFATNINIGDLDMISRNSLPMYILTVDEENLDNISSQYLKSLKFPVEFIEVSAIQGYPFREDRLKLLKLHCDNLSEIMDICMAYAERKVMEKKKQGYSSFRIYEDILRLTYSDDLYWWNSKDLSSIKQICDAYTESRELMEIPAIRNEAIHKFYTEYMQEGDYADQITEVVCNPQDSERDSILACLRDHFYYGKEIEAIEKYAQKRDAEQETLLRQCRSEMEEKLNVLEDRLCQEKEQIKKSMSEEHTAAMEAKKKELQELTDSKLKMRMELEQELADERAKHRDVLRKKEQELTALTADRESLSRENRDLQIKLRRSNGYTGDVDIEGLERTIEEHRHTIGALKKGRTACLVLAILFALTGGGAVAYGGLKAIPDLKVSLRASFESEMESQAQSESVAESERIAESESESERVAESESESEAESARIAESEAESKRIAESEEESKRLAESEVSYEPLGIFM